MKHHFKTCVALCKIEIGCKWLTTRWKQIGVMQILIPTVFISLYHFKCEAIIAIAFIAVNEKSNVLIRCRNRVLVTILVQALTRRLTFIVENQMTCKAHLHNSNYYSSAVNHLQGIVNFHTPQRFSFSKLLHTF